MTAGLHETLAKAQNAVERWALGIPNSTVASSFIQGELGWSSFTAREAQSKMRYFERISQLPEERWARGILEMWKNQTKVKSAAYSRMTELRRQFGCEEISLTYNDGRPCFGKFKKDIQKQIGLTVDDMWEKEMGKKSTLARYRNFKVIRGSKEVRYDNTRGSALLALARAGALPTKGHRARYTPGLDSTCTNCGVYEETVEHVLHECGDRYVEDIETDELLGFTDCPNPATQKNVMRLLENWERTMDLRWSRL